MTYDFAQLETWLAAEGGQYFGKTERPRSIAFQRAHSIVIARLEFTDDSKKVVVKKVENTEESNVAEFFETQNRIGDAAHRVSCRMPGFYGYHDSLRCIAMECVPGPPLLDLLKADLAGRLRKTYCCDCLLTESATILATLNRLTPSEVGVSTATRSHQSFVDAFDELLQELVVQWRLSRIDAPLRRLVESLPAEFLTRVGNRLLLKDFQPKNILVPSPERVCVIDLDYLSGPAALNIGLFTVTLDRLHLRYFSPKAAKRIEHWKQHFLHEYFRCAENPAAVDAFPFFYAWSTLITMKEHAQQRPRLGLYLARRYASLLTNFLDEWARGKYSTCWKCDRGACAAE